MSIPRPNYTYRATVVRVVDADTIDVDIDVGFYITVRKRLRLLDFDAEELRDRDPVRREKAKVATARVEELLEDTTVYVQTEMDSTGKYGRLLAWVWYENVNELTNLNKQMVAEGYQKEPRT